MRIDQLALLLALVLAANLLLLIALLVPRFRRRRGRSAGAYAGVAGGASADGQSGLVAESAESLLASAGLPKALYQRMTRVVSFVFIGSAMAIVALTGTRDAAAIIVVLAAGLIVIELLQDVVPVSLLGRLRLPLEAAVVLTLLTVLIAMTGGHQSPYFFGYILVVGGAALSTSELAAAILAVLSSGAYLVAVYVALNGVPLDTPAVGLVAFNLVSIALVMYVASVIGSTQRRAREAALSLSRFDPMTGLLTTKYFVLAVEHEIRRAARSPRPFAFIMADLDGLKSVNEQFGLAGGDQLIKGAADAIRSVVRATDVVARNSGAADEFFVMLPDTDLGGAEVVAENIRVEISRVALPGESKTMRSTASIGVLTFPEDARSWEELKARSNLAEQEAKKRGGNVVVRYRDLALPAGSTHVKRRPMTEQPPGGDGSAARVASRTAAAPSGEMPPGAPGASGEIPPATPGRAPWEPA